MGGGGAGAVGAGVHTEPAGQSLAMDDLTELLFHDGGEVGEVLQGEGSWGGQAGDQG